MAQSNPEARLQSLPPILRRTTRKSLPSCSKGSWGLSVFPRVEGIFTPNVISLSPWSRQCGCCYAIRAGRNFVFIPRFPVAQTIPSPNRSELRARLHARLATKTRAGVLCTLRHIQGSHSLSRYGDSSCDDLTLGITRDAPVSAGRAPPI